MSTKKVFLVIGADRKVRAAVHPRIQLDEVAIAVTLKFPDTWGKVLKTIEVDVPDFAPEVTVDGAS